MSTIDFIVNFKGKNISFTDWLLNSTIGQIKFKLADETGISSDGQKLIWKGKILRDDEATLASLGIQHNNKITMMGTQLDQVAAVQQLDKKIAERQLARPRKPTQVYRASRSVKDIKYTFHSIKVLPEFQQQDKARQLLERLRDDRGVRAIMEQRRWSVGELIELSPVEASLLGYNRNAGQLIAVRLRTNDFTGFRHYDSIRKVLLHELTHNVWSEHDDNFHALNRQLNKDVVALDWTAHGGHQMASSGAFYQPGEDDEQPSVTWEAGTYRLGGKQQSTSSGDMASAALRRKQAAQAALSRLTKQEEQEMDEGCGS